MLGIGLPPLVWILRMLDMSSTSVDPSDVGYVIGLSLYSHGNVYIAPSISAADLEHVQVPGDLVMLLTCSVYQ